jgi:membrane protease YdiL (CAAX protease family)
VDRLERNMADAGDYLRIVNKHFSLLKSSLIVGMIWGVWLLPLWFVSGFQGVNLLLYIVFFMIGLVSFSVIIGYIYGRGGNLLYPILLHQMLNFSGKLLESTQADRDEPLHLNASSK